MKYLKLFENFDIDSFDIEELEDILISISDYGFKFEDVSTGSAIKINRDYVDNASYFSINEESYKHFSIKFKSQGYSFLNDDFFQELSFIIEHIESRYNIKLHCIFTSMAISWVNRSRSPTGLKHVYYKNVDVFRNKLRSIFADGEIRVKYNKLELMFEIK